ncbi:hypothetical protein H0H93_008141 [Arthromyces matolae]|nr:hypothetical protein H0H93_008141 [Arthromyces matolae]
MPQLTLIFIGRGFRSVLEACSFSSAPATLPTHLNEAEQIIIVHSDMDLADTTFKLFDAIEIIQEARYAIAAVYCLQIYEWLSTLRNEIEVMHTRSRWTTVRVAYLICRYYPLLLWPVVIVAYCGTWSYQFCTVMLMRAYAFTGRDKRVLILLLGCFSGLLAVDIWAFCTDITTLPEIAFITMGGTGCFPYYGKGFLGFRIVFNDGGYIDGSSLSDSLACGLKGFAFVIVANVIAAGLFFKYRIIPNFTNQRSPRDSSQNSPHNALGLPFALAISNLIACRVILGLRKKGMPTETLLNAQNSFLVRDALRVALPVPVVLPKFQELQSEKDEWGAPSEE